MKKNVKEFLKYLEMETSITVDLSTASPTRKGFNINNQPICVNVVGIYDGAFGLAVYACGCKNCKKIVGVEVLYCCNEIESDALDVKNQIEMAVTSVPVEIRLVDAPD